MDLMWLKTVDVVSRVPPRWLLDLDRRSATEGMCVLRPGGLGDLVLLTRACLEEKLNPLQVRWMVERRNSPWLEFLGIPHECYDTVATFVACARGRRRFAAVVNTEQTFGLATVFARRLVGERGTLIGFGSNRRADLQDVSLPYDHRESELCTFRRVWQIASHYESRLPSGHFVMPSPDRPQEKPYSVAALGGLQLAYKRLSLDDWAGLLRVAAAGADTLYLLGAARDREFADKLCSSAPVHVINLVGRLGFAQVVAYVSGATRVVGVDSGLIHIADFYGVPSDVVIQDRLVSKWGPRTHGSRTVARPDQLLQGA